LACISADVCVQLKYKRKNHMKELKSLMIQSYREHPAFRFDDKSWVLANNELNIFNETFTVLRQIARSLKGKSFSFLQNTCLDVLERIFSSMLVQSADKYEKYFLSELHAECIRLINEELAWYARPPCPKFILLQDDIARSAALNMHTNRFFFGQLPLIAVEELRCLAAKDLIKFRANADAGRLKRDDLSVSNGVVVRAIRDILNREFAKLGVLDAVSSYVGRKTRVTGLALELSVAQATWWKNSIEGIDRPPNTLYAHYDESIQFPKSIVYLTDVTDQNGPTSCYPGAYESMQLNPLQEIIGRIIGTVGNRADSPLREYYNKKYHQSANCRNFRKHFMRLPEVLRFNSHMGWDVAPAHELETLLSSNEHKMTGPAGTFIAFDGARLLHRGGLMQKGERLALQVIFSDLTFSGLALSKIKRMFL
jgi:hypothetical protein